MPAAGLTEDFKLFLGDSQRLDCAQIAQTPVHEPFQAIQAEISA
jgi:hypothetical protein